MREYKAFYKNKTCIVMAETSYAAQLIAARSFNAKHTYDVSVILVDVVLDTCVF